MTESSPANDKPLFVLRLGDLHKPLAPGRSYTIGRSPDCDLRLGHGSVAELHCRLQVEDGEVIAHAIDARAGIKVDGNRLLAQTWSPGQVLEVGDIRVELQVAQAVWTDQQVAAAAAQLHSAQYSHDREFGAIVFSELKRAPWFAISILIHAAALLLLWLVLDDEVPKGITVATFSVEQTEAEEDVTQDEPEEQAIENAASMADTEFVETELLEEVSDTFMEEVDAPELDRGVTDMGDLMRKVGSSGTGLDDILKEGKSGLTGSFTKGVRKMREDGLEIVFCFDSTGSMGAVLLAAKERMAKMASVLLELVPNARIGVITYRDADKDEEYLTRDVQLSSDFYRAINFLQGVFAGGGGDTPEAVYEALRKATSQPWGKTSQRLVVLIGDAEPHERTEGRISSMVKNFAHNGRSFVHAITTRPSSEIQVSPKCRKTFERIARDGRGQALTFDDEAQILKAVMSLAFGREEQASLEEIYRRAELRSTKYSKPAESLARGENLPALRREFRRPVISHDIVKAILHRPTRAVLLELVDIAGRSAYKPHARHAASYILQKSLLLEAPPVDAEDCKPIEKRMSQLLKRMIRRKFE